MVARSDDWSGNAPIPSAKVLAPQSDTAGDQNGGIRREPELPQHEEVVVRAPPFDNEFDDVPDEGDADAVQASAMNRSMQGLARAVSLDPDDKMGL
jgi:type IV secretion system protein VirD4